METLNAGKKIEELTGMSELNPQSLMLVHDGTGLKQSPVGDATPGLAHRANICINNATIVKDITDEWYNGTLRDEVKAGNFTHVKPGNYIIGRMTGTKWWVVHLDYYYGKRTEGYSKAGYAENTHHIAVMPQVLLDYSRYSTHLWSGYEYNGSSTAVMEQGCAPWSAASGATTGSGTNDTSGGYHNSYIRNTVLPKVYKYWLSKDFDNVYPFYELNTTAINTSAISSGCPTGTGSASAWGWFTQTEARCTLPSVENIIGGDGWTSCGMDIGALKDQFAIFAGGMKFIEFTSGVPITWRLLNTWTKNLGIACYACTMENENYTGQFPTSYPFAIRPVAFVG